MKSLLLFPKSRLLIEILEEPTTKRFSLRRFVAFISFILFILGYLCNLFHLFYVYSTYLYVNVSILLLSLGLVNAEQLIEILKTLKNVKKNNTN